MGVDMLKKFSFKNYKSFKDSVTLDFTASKIREFNDSIISVGSEKVLPLIALFGANASGKSTVYAAFEYMSEYVAYSFRYGDEEENVEEYKPIPFLLDSYSVNNESEFEIYFTIPGDKTEKSYNYGFCIDKNGIKEEWLRYKAKTARKYSNIFTRKNDDIDLSGLPKKSRDNILVSLEKQVLIVSLGAKLKIDKCKMVRDWFINNEFADFGNPFTNLVLSRMLPDGFVDDEVVQKDIIRYFDTFGEHIVGFHIEKDIREVDSKSDIYTIYVKHRMMDGDGCSEIPLSAESAGTLKMFALYSMLNEVFKKGSVLFIDELNARLHPLLVRNIIEAFMNPDINVKQAQIVFTSHDTWQMSSKLLRRDEIWFTEKDDNGISRLYSLAEYDPSEEQNGKKVTIRKDENYEKNYLLGNYGAVPVIKKLEMLGGGEDN